MQTRLPSQALRLLWAFDFDGVVCHSAKELCLTGAWLGPPVGRLCMRAWVGWCGWSIGTDVTGSIDAWGLDGLLADMPTSRFNRPTYPPMQRPTHLMSYHNRLVRRPRLLARADRGLARTVRACLFRGLPRRASLSITLRQFPSFP